jgi:hypothetical protein
VALRKSQPRCPNLKSVQVVQNRPGCPFWTSWTVDKGFQECPRGCPRAFSALEYYSEYCGSTVVVHGIGNVDNGKWTVFDNTSRIAQTSLTVGLGSLPVGLVNLLERQLS